MSTLNAKQAQECCEYCIRQYEVLRCIKTWLMRVECYVKKVPPARVKADPVFDDADGQSEQ